MNKAIVELPFLPTILLLKRSTDSAPPGWFCAGKTERKTLALPTFLMPVVTSRSRVSQGLEGKRAFKVDDYGAVRNDEKQDNETIHKAVAAVSENPGDGIVFFRWKAPCFPRWIACKTDPDFQNQDGFKWRWKCCRGYLDLPGNMRVNGKLRFKSSGPGQEKLTTLT